MNLLIIEDDRELCGLLKDSLKKYNYILYIIYGGTI